jgi:hypothetical protein
MIAHVELDLPAAVTSDTWQASHAINERAQNDLVEVDKAAAQLKRCTMSVVLSASVKIDAPRCVVERSRTRIFGMCSCCSAWRSVKGFYPTEDLALQSMAGEELGTFFVKVCLPPDETVVEYHSRAVFA